MSTFSYYVPARNGGHRLRCRCPLCVRYPNRAQRAVRALRQAGIYAAAVGAFVGAYALGAALDARDAATCPTITAEVLP